MIPFLVVCDAFQSETVAFADLVLPDTTYLERHDVMSMLDRPISEFDGPVDSVRIPVVPPTGECKPFQEVLVELASRLKFPAFTTRRGQRASSRTIPDFVVNFEPQPGVGFLMGWRGKDGTEHLRGAPNPKQWEMYAKNNCVFQYHMPESMHYMRNWNRAYLDFAKDKGWRQKNDVIQLALYSDTLQTLPPRRAGQDDGPAAARASARAHRRPTSIRCRSGIRRSKTRRPTPSAYPLNAITQRPMAMYHSWDSQNAWLRQIHSHNYLQVNPLTAQAAGIADGGWCWVESQWGQRALHAALQRGRRAGHGLDLERDRQGRRRLAARARRRRGAKGFLLNHLITEELPLAGSRRARSATPIRSPARPAGTTCACASVPAEPERAAGDVPAGRGHARRARRARQRRRAC